MHLLFLTSCFIKSCHYSYDEFQWKSSVENIVKFDWDLGEIRQVLFGIYHTDPIQLLRFLESKLHYKLDMIAHASARQTQHGCVALLYTILLVYTFITEC